MSISTVPAFNPIKPGLLQQLIKPGGGANKPPPPT